MFECASICLLFQGCVNIDSETRRAHYSSCFRVGWHTLHGKKVAFGGDPMTAVPIGTVSRIRVHGLRDITRK